MSARPSYPVPEDIVFMLKAGPGKYAVTSDPDARYYVMVEVDEKGQVHQLKTDGVTRDGILSNDGWDPRAPIKVYRISEQGTTMMFIRIGHPQGDKL